MSQQELLWGAGVKQLRLVKAKYLDGVMLLRVLLLRLLLLGGKFLSLKNHLFKQAATFQKRRVRGVSQMKIIQQSKTNKCQLQVLLPGEEEEGGHP